MNKYERDGNNQIIVIKASLFSKEAKNKDAEREGESFLPLKDSSTDDFSQHTLNDNGKNSIRFLWRVC